MMSTRTYTDKCASVSCVYPDIIAVSSHFLALNRSYKSYRTALLLLCRMADLSLLRTAAHLYDVVPNSDTSIPPPRRTPSNPPSSPSPPSKTIATATSRRLHLNCPNKMQREHTYTISAYANKASNHTHARTNNQSSNYYYYYYLCLNQKKNHIYERTNEEKK